MRTIPVEFYPNTHAFQQSNCPCNIDELCEFLRGVGVKSDFTVLQNYIRQNEDVFFSMVRFLWEEAQQDFLIPQPLRQVGSIVLTQRSCLRILANAFFCTFVHRPRWEEYPSINFNLLYDGRESILTAKLHMFMGYFASCKSRIQDGDELSRKLVL